MNIFKKFVRVFFYTPNKVYDELPEPRRFLTFFIPFITFYVLTDIYSLTAQILGVCGLLLYRVGYAHNLYNFSKE